MAVERDGRRSGGRAEGGGLDDDVLVAAGIDVPLRNRILLQRNRAALAVDFQPARITGIDRGRRLNHADGAACKIDDRAERVLSLIHISFKILQHRFFSDTGQQSETPKLFFTVVEGDFEAGVLLTRQIDDVVTDRRAGETGAQFDTAAFGAQPRVQLGQKPVQPADRIDARRQVGKTAVERAAREVEQAAFGLLYTSAGRPGRRTRRPSRGFR